MSFDAIPVQITYGGGQIAGSIAKINPTGMIIELDRIPFQVGLHVQVTFTLEGVGHYTAEVRPIKAYDNYKKKVRVETENGPAIEERMLKLSEVHFVAPSEDLRAGIMKYLMTLQVSLLKKTK